NMGDMMDLIDQHISYAWSPDGKDRFTPVYPKENVFLDSAKEEHGENEFLGYRINLDMAPLIDLYGVDRYYTLSFDLKGAVAGKISVYSQNGSRTKYDIGIKTIDATTEYQRFSYTFKPKLSAETETKAFLAFYGTYGSGVIPYAKNIKFSLEDGSLIYTTNPQDDYDNSTPRYIGRSLKDSTNPADFTWEPNPERKPWTVYAQGLNGEGLSLMPYGENKIIRAGEKSNTTVGFYGIISSYTGSSLMNGYISVSSGQNLIFIKDGADNAGGDAYWRYKFTDSNDSLITRIANVSNNFTVTVPTSATRLYVSYPATNKVKIELANTMGIPTPWTPAPSEDPLGAIPKYVGTAALPYDDWTKYDWRLSSDWNEVKTSTSIDQTNEAIILKADQTTVNEVTGRVTTAEGKITLLSDRMNFRITNSDGSITQIDLANKVISLSGEQVNITGNTYISNGVIKTAAIADLAVSTAKIANLSVSEGKIADLAVSNAKIANLAVSTAKIADLAVTNAKIGSISADKINVGTLNAANVNIINLNASNITTGTISGTNLSINLATGVVNFKKGRINSASNNIDINIDAGYFSVADSSTRVIIKGGELQFVSPTIFDLDTNPYLSIDNSGGSQGLYGASIVGRDFISLANRANNTNMFDIPIGLEAFAGISFGKPSGSWRPTKIGGAERGIILSGGAALSDSLDSFKGSPRIVIGSDVDGQAGGNRIYILGEYIHMRSVYTKTTSTAANVVVATDGALVRSTSASKYKSDIQRFYDTSIGEKLLDLPYATWLDKAEMQRYSENPTLPIPRKNFGMIAEDLADAGLEELVVRGENNQLEGIQYERLAVALIPVIRELKQEIETLKARVA
ncbi:hypothetical protein, partial [Enterococcus italicus]